VTHIYIKPSSNQCVTTSREASAAGRLRPNALTGKVEGKIRFVLLGFAKTHYLVAFFFQNEFMVRVKRFCK